MKTIIDNYILFNSWSNTKIINFLKSQTKELAEAAAPSSFGSINLTLQHILKTQEFWHLFIMEKDFTSFSWKLPTQKPDDTFNQLLSQSILLETDIVNLSETQLQSILHLNTSWANSQFPRYEYILHMVNHSTYHRGQVITQLRSLGITNNIPATDYHFYLTRLMQ